MKDDLFAGKLWRENAKDRREPAPPPPMPQRRADDRTYTAFDTREHADCLHIHCATQPSHYPSYHYLMNVIFDHDFQSAFTLVFSFMSVEVTGRNLASVVHAISFRSCERIREFHTKFHDQPAKDQPVIESIKVTAAVKFLAETETA